MKAVLRPAAALALVLALGGCDEEDDVTDPPEHTDVPAAIEGCPDGAQLVDIGETRACACDDGTQSEQTCLSTGRYADCKCDGNGW